VAITFLSSLTPVCSVDFLAMAAIMVPSLSVVQPLADHIKGNDAMRDAGKGSTVIVNLPPQLNRISGRLDQNRANPSRELKLIAATPLPFM
jgi:hypothetical protein